MASDDFFRARLDSKIDLRHPLAVLATSMPWAEIEAHLAPLFAHRDRSGKRSQKVDVFGPSVALSGAGVSNAGRPRLAIRLMVALLYLKHAFGLSEEELVERWSENVVWQFFSGMTYYEPRLPCDATQIGRFRRVLGEAGVEQLLKSTIESAVAMGAVKKAEFERVIVDTTVQEKAIVFPTDSRLLEATRIKLVGLAKGAGIGLKQTFEREGKALRRKACGYAHAKQFKRLRRTTKRQRTIVGILLRSIRRQMSELQMSELGQEIQQRLAPWLERAERIMRQRPHDKGKLYALHAPEAECIGKGKARQPYEFGVKVSLAVTHKQGLMVGARRFPGNLYDGHTLAAQLERTGTLLQDIGVKPVTAVVDVGYRSKEVEQAIAPVELIHRCKTKTLTAQQKGWLRRRQAIEPAIGHAKAGNGMRRCWLKGEQGDALNAVLCAAGFNIRWLMRAILRLGLAGLLLALFGLWQAWLRAVNSADDTTSELLEGLKTGPRCLCRRSNEFRRADFLGLRREWQLCGGRFWAVSVGGGSAVTRRSQEEQSFCRARTMVGAGPGASACNCPTVAGYVSTPVPIPSILGAGGTENLRALLCQAERST